MAKIYVVSEIYASYTEIIQDRYFAFTDIEKAIACKDELISLWDHEMCENFDCLSSELTNYIDVLHDLNLIYHVVVSDLELKIEVRAVELE